MIFDGSNYTLDVRCAMLNALAMETNHTLGIYAVPIYRVGSHRDDNYYLEMYSLTDGRWCTVIAYAPRTNISRFLRNAFRVVEDMLYNLSSI